MEYGQSLAAEFRIDGNDSHPFRPEIHEHAEEGAPLAGGMSGHRGVYTVVGIVREPFVQDFSDEAERERRMNPESTAVPQTLPPTWIKHCGGI